MATQDTGYRNANAYYGGQYNPVNIYGNRSQQEPISMYNPQAEAQFLQATQMAQERFDKASMAASQSLATIGGMDTYDAPELQQRLKSTQDKINKLVQDKYNGDYGAASNEIVNIIGAERTNPFYKFNQQKLAAAKTFQEDKRRIGAGFMSANDPMSVSFKDWQEGEDFSYSPIDREDIVNNSASMFKSIANQLMSDPNFRSTNQGKFLERTLQYGFKNIDDARDYLQNDKTGVAMVQELMRSMPALAGLNQTDVMDAIVQGAGSGIGQSRFEPRADPGYETEYDKAGLAALEDDRQTPGYDFTSPATPAMFPGKLKDLLESKSLSSSPEIDSFIAKTAKKQGLPNIKSYKDLQELQKINMVTSVKLGLQMVGKGQYGGMPSPEESDEFQKNMDRLIGKSKDIGTVMKAFEDEYNEVLSGTPYLQMQRFDLRTVTLKERPQVEGMLRIFQQKLLIS